MFVLTMIIRGVLCLSHAGRYRAKRTPVLWLATFDSERDAHHLKLVIGDGAMKTTNQSFIHFIASHGIRGFQIVFLLLSGDPFSWRCATSFCAQRCRRWRLLRW